MKNKNVHLNIPLEVIKLIVAQLPQEDKQEVVEILVEEKKPLEEKKRKKKLEFKGFLKGMKADEEDFTQAEKELFKQFEKEGEPKNTVYASLPKTNISFAEFKSLRKELSSSWESKWDL